MKINIDWETAARLLTDFDYFKNGKQDTISFLELILESLKKEDL